jgi:hypothetical protein
MTNQCCCGYNTPTFCVGCDLGSFTSASVTAVVSGFTDNYACPVATHVNRTNVHTNIEDPAHYGNISPYPNLACCDTLIAGNANPPEDKCKNWCFPGSNHYPNDRQNNCPPDIDIGANSVPGIVFNYTNRRVDGCVLNWECRCVDYCDHIKEGPAWSNLCYVGPTCYLTIWYSLCFMQDKADPSNSLVTYSVAHSYAGDAYRDYDYSSRSWCDYCHPARACCENFMYNPFNFFGSYINYYGESTYNSDQPCSSIGPITINLCPDLPFGNLESDLRDCNWPDSGNQDTRDPSCRTDLELCGPPLNHDNATVVITLNLS